VVLVGPTAAACSSIRPFRANTFDGARGEKVAVGTLTIRQMTAEECARYARAASDSRLSRRRG